MKIYHTETQEDYDALMMELEERGVLWFEVDKPTEVNCWLHRKEETAIFLRNDKMITHGSLIYAKKDYPDVPIIKYERDICQEMFIERLVENHDVVNSPKHYTNGELEVIDILQDKLTSQEFEGFLKGNILKYTFREGIKNGTEDMKKGAWYMSKLIDFRNEQED